MFLSVRAVVECNGAGIFNGPLRTLTIARGNRINAVCEHPSAFRSFQTRCGEADSLQRPQPHFMGLSVAVVAEDPGTRICAAHLQIEAIPVGEHSRLASVRDLQC